MPAVPANDPATDAAVRELRDRINAVMSACARDLPAAERAGDRDGADQLRERALAAAALLHQLATLVAEHRGRPAALAAALDAVVRPRLARLA